MLRIVKRIMPLLLLIAMDQIIKFYIFTKLMDKEIDIIPNMIGFKPVINSSYSWINSISNFGIGLLPHLLFNTLVLVMAYLVYDFIREQYGENRIIYSLFLFLFAGGICSLIDKITTGGSLDYVWLKGFFIFDLKDIYLSTFTGISILCVVTNHKGILKLSERVLLKEFWNFLKRKYLKHK